MGFWNDLETVGRAVAKGPDGVKYVFIGDGIRKKELVSAIGSSAANTLFLPFLSNEEYSYSVTACHCGLVTLRNEALGMGVPSKIFGIMAAGIPVLAIAPKDSEIAQIVLESECGLVVEPGDVDSLLSSIKLLKADPELRVKMGKNARFAFEKKYTVESGVRNYLKLFNELL
jgi:glycosyltransferase involved in cell wall biosynthesis